jgi:hypothetical protein
METSATVKMLVSMAVGSVVGVLSVECGPMEPVGGGRSLTGKTPAVATGNATGGSEVVIDLTPSAGPGGSTGSSSATVTVMPASAAANCGIQTRNPTSLPVDLLLVLDRSGSMNDDIASNATCGNRGAPAGCAARWPTMTGALAQVLAASPAGVQWGLKLFTSPGGQVCTVNPGADVAVGPDTAAQIEAAIAGTTPQGETPTSAAMNAAISYFNTVNDGLAHYMLLATDGQPNCDPGTSGNVTTKSVGDTVAAITTAAAPGSDIETYVIGIGPSIGNLDNFATAGGTGTYFPATSPGDLTSALSAIAGAVASCVFTMDAAPPDPSNLGVYLDKGTKVPPDTLNGYSLGADGVTVTFSGTFCDGIKNGTYHVMQVFFGCPGGPSPPEIVP